MSKPALCRYLKEQRTPRSEIAERIIEATGGMVTLHDLIPPSKVRRPKPVSKKKPKRTA